MDDIKRKELLERNNNIIKVVKEQIELICPDSIDLIGIAGSFCNGNYYEKSDLDLVIVTNDLNKADELSKCFILDGVGFDIYLSTWDRFDSMAQYNNLFVTKLKQLDIIYTRNEECLDKYKEYQELLNSNMNDDVTIKNKCNKYLSECINILNNINMINNKEFYKTLGLIMNKIENIIFLSNKEYLHGSTINILDELSSPNIPINFINRYKSLINISNKEEIINVLESILEDIKEYYGLELITIHNDISESKSKKDITPNDITGTYEELYSNYYNKLYHAAEINNQFLSFRTMVDAQLFFDEIYDEYNIEEYDLVGYYNPTGLEANANKFAELLNKWKELYDSLSINIEIYNSINDIYRK